MLRSFYVLVLLCSVQLLLGQDKDFYQYEAEKYSSIRDIKSVASTWFDVSYYKLNLTISTAPQIISGDVTIKGVCKEAASTPLVFDLMNSMRVDSVVVNDILHTFIQEPSSIIINIDTLIPQGQWLTVKIYYAGFPISTGFGSFEFGEHNGTPWVWSLSEPYGARDWFPCKDHPSDKADSADVIVTCDSSFKVGSNGKLVSITNNADGTKTHHWHEQYPIASYLISVAITNYMEFSDWFHYSENDSMEILNYVLPENFSAAKEHLSKTVDMLQIFSKLFGLYPFIKEKYGHADFGRGGAMEHQTMTSTTTYNENTIAHELAHQWFGDMITCRTWSDLWLNEGFAQYATALYLENKYGKPAYQEYIKNQMNNARHAVGSLYVIDTSDVRNLFNVNRVYAKGASVLHMLRYVLGDSIFFKSIYNYANDNSYKYGTASTYDFQNVCESTSGMDLKYFFDQWVFGEGYPRYSFKWELSNANHQYLINLNLSQVGDYSNPPFFIMPIEFKFIGNGWDTTVSVIQSYKDQSFSFLINHFVKYVQLDPDGWILKDVIEEFHHPFYLFQCYPNPVETRANMIYQIPSRMYVEISIFNTLGQKVKTLFEGIQQAGVHEITWDDVNRFPIGVYFYRLKTPTQIQTKKLILIKH